MFNPKTKDYQEQEFINWQIQNASWGKLDCLTDPFKIPHAQHWIMLSSLNQENFKVPTVKDNWPMLSFVATKNHLGD